MVFHKNKPYTLTSCWCKFHFLYWRL